MSQYPSAGAKGRRPLHAAVSSSPWSDAVIDKTLAWLIAGSMSTTDVTAAAVVYRIRQARPSNPPPVVEDIREWEDRVTAFDR